MAKKYKATQNASVSADGWKNAVAPVVAALFFILLCLGVNDTIKTVTMISVGIMFVTGLIGLRKWKERFSVPMLMLALFITMNGVSTFYALAGKFALSEFLKILMAFALTMTLLAIAPGEGVAPGRYMATVLSRCSAFAGLVSIDLMSTRLISGAVTGFLHLFTAAYKNQDGIVANVRMLSMFDNPNVFAGMAGIGVMLALGLVLSSESKKERMGHLVCLFLSAYSFVLGFSMGGTATVAVAFLAYLLVERKERKAGLLVLMLETFVVTMLCVAITAVLAFDAWTGIQPIPLLCAVAGSAALCALDQVVGQKVAEKLAAWGKAVLVIILTIVILLVGFCVLGYNLTGSMTLNAGERVERSVYLDAGEYTLQSEVEGNVKVSIRYQNSYDTMMLTSTNLYSGELEGASFIVPEDSMVVFLTFSTEEGATLNTVTCNGPETASVPLDSKLLPGFIANRLQGLWATQTFIQRTVFFEDGLKLFKQSPVIGLGLGSFENAVAGIQSFHYETKYTHNHYIQVLAETGIVGLILFVLTFLTSIVAIVFELRKKEGSHPLVPALLAALVFMAGHGAVEVVFSTYVYLPMAFGVFGLVSMCCTDVAPFGWFKEKVRVGALIACAVLVAVFLFFLSNNMKAAKLIEERATMENFEKASKMDKFEWADYSLSYVMSASYFAEDPVVQEKAEEHARRLAEVNSNTIPLYLADYYFGKGNVDQAVAMLEKYVHYVSSDSEAWNNTFAMLGTNGQDTEEYKAHVQRIAQIMTDWEAENIGTIELNDLSKVILAQYGVIKIEGYEN